MPMALVETDTHAHQRNHRGKSRTDNTGNAGLADAQAGNGNGQADNTYNEPPGHREMAETGNARGIM
ncbi:hypothetical protein FBR06_08085 [Betaproteobacteria bacterium PRO4]|uniref:hypothetical protein n=1 Tax=Nitrosomonas sp. TaxID=42353 RepID=UPI00256CD3BB|nr:hypothetical protein [Nitrosomonas sp.]MDL1867182.1 hypothetical protein [Betaproteobacteria bacterium PRO4]